MIWLNHLWDIQDQKCCVFLRQSGLLLRNWRGVRKTKAEWHQFSNTKTRKINDSQYLGPKKYSMMGQYVLRSSIILSLRKPLCLFVCISNWRVILECIWSYRPVGTWNFNWLHSSCVRKLKSDKYKFDYNLWTKNVSIVIKL